MRGRRGVVGRRRVWSVGFRSCPSRRDALSRARIDTVRGVWRMVPRDATELRGRRASAVSVQRGGRSRRRARHRHDVSSRASPRSRALLGDWSGARRGRRMSASVDALRRRVVQLPDRRGAPRTWRRRSAPPRGGRSRACGRGRVRPVARPSPLPGRAGPASRPRGPRRSRTRDGRARVALRQLTPSSVGAGDTGGLRRGTRERSPRGSAARPPDERQGCGASRRDDADRPFASVVQEHRDRAVGLQREVVVCDADR